MAGRRREGIHSEGEQALVKAAKMRCFIGMTRYLAKRCVAVLFIELGNVFHFDVFWTNCFALTVVCARAKAFFVHLVDHVLNAALPLCLALRQH